MKNFKQYFTEGTISVPHNVLDEIWEYIKKAYIYTHDFESLKYTDEWKHFKVDLTGTKYEFLNDVASKTPIQLALSVYSGPDAGAPGTYNSSAGNLMHLNINELQQAYSLLQHEFAHYIQDMIDNYIGEEKKDVGGMSKQSIKSTADYNNDYESIEDYDIYEPDELKSTIASITHSNLPWEHHTNMVSLLNTMTMWEATTKMSKEMIFKIVTRDARIEEFRRRNYPKYKNYMKHLYNEFMHDYDNTDIKKVYADIEHIYKRFPPNADTSEYGRW